MGRTKAPDTTFVSHFTNNNLDIKIFIAKEGVTE